MPGASPEAPRRVPGSEELLRLAFDRPADALAGAEALLADRPNAVQSSVAHQVIGLVQREFGRVDLAIVHLRRAVAAARRAGSREREADVLATFGIALIHAGRPTAGLASLDRSVELSAGHARTRARFRRAGALEILGRHEEALRDLRAVVPALRRAGDDVWTARALTVRGTVLLAGGETRRADRDFDESETLSARTGQRHEYAVARHNRGLVAFRERDLPTALMLLHDAGERYRELGSVIPELAKDRCAVLLAAGLAVEALEEADAAASNLQRQRGTETRRAELQLIGARAAAAAGDHAGAAHRAEVARVAFDRQGREWWSAHSQLVVVQARFAERGGSGRVLAAARGTADRLHRLGSPESAQADLLAGRVALTIERDDEAALHLDSAAKVRLRGPAASRVTGWLARALLAESRGDSAVVLAASRRGLALLNTHLLALGATELRARATAQGAELAELALRAGLRSGGARQLLVRCERWRAVASAVPPVRPPDDPDAVVDLAALRELTVRIDDARARGDAVTVLDRDRRRLEGRIRDRALRAPVPSGADRLPVGMSVDRLVAELGDHTRLVEIVAVDGDLHVLVCGRGAVRRFRAGRATDATAVVERARWLLRRAAHIPGSASDERLVRVGERLQEHLLGSAVAALGDGEIVLVPPGRLQGAPWALLPALADRVHAVAPSARAWLVARRTPVPDGERVVLVRGPGLGSEGAEIDTIRGLHPHAVVLDGDRATSTSVAMALESASLAHVAAHGHFRAESPLLSSLRMVDGPLTVYDLERLRRAPHRLVLSSCDSGQLAAVGADELLGLATALLPLGTAGVVAGLVPVNDEATVAVMMMLHRAIAAGESLPRALALARVSASNDPLLDVTARSFVAIGAA